ncbi:LysR family transcriptional regulator [Oceanobacter mangrovi]|uniref:LysR family transcriptional regulator n=1 Tax=Oceanobacter mangrovi TaxID=2862510 RepID=UPI001C8D5945|nr:LysR family transcriptional regulator [Oceanobacter mangrovi]
MNRKYSLGQLGDYEIKQLKIFKTIVDCGGFSAAEAQLNISRPTISIHIANLESRLNLTLCKRGRGGFSLTEEGKVIYEQTQSLLDALEGFRNTINNLSSFPSGLLEVALSDTFATDDRCQVTDIIRRYHQHAPDVELKVTVEHMIDMERKVLAGELDIAFIPYHRKLEGLEYIHIFTDRCYLYCAPGNPLFDLPEDQLTDELVNSIPLIHAGLKPHDEVYAQIAEMNLAAVCYHYEARIALMLSGIYISYLPENFAAPYVQRGELKAISPRRRFFTLGAAVISKKSAQPNRARTLFLETVRAIHPPGEKSAPY